MPFNAAVRAEMLSDLEKVVENKLPKDGVRNTTVAMTEAAVDIISTKIEAQNAPTRIALERDDTNVIVGFVIFDGRISTYVFPLTTSNGVVWLNKAPIFVAHKRGPELLLGELVAEIERKERTMK